MSPMPETSAPVKFDAARARFNMIQQQIRPWEVVDDAVLQALDAIPREHFTLPAHRALAYADLALPTSPGGPAGESMLPPKIQARMVQDAALSPADHALLIGAGTGYMAALLGRLAQRVVALEINPQLAERARANLQRAGITNVELITADATERLFEPCTSRGPFDAIVLAGSTLEVPPELLTALKRGGRLVAIVGEEPIMRATVITRTADAGYASVQPWDYTAPRLLHFPEAPRFQF